MARKIRLDQIGDKFRKEISPLVAATTLEATARLKLATPVFSLSTYTKEELDSMPMYFKVQGKTVPLKKALLEHGTGGRLREGWIPEIEEFEGVVENRVEYAEPVCYGTNLPPSWNGQYRTRQGTVPGFPDLIAKELESWAKKEYQKIVRGMG